jgi:leukotriene-A4 hydrolase
VSHSQRGGIASFALAVSSSALIAGALAATPPAAPGVGASAMDAPRSLAASRPDLAPMQSGLDYHSFANVEQFRVSHVELDLRVDFHNQVLFGEVALEVKRLDPNATELVLDTRGLDIRDVSEKPTSVVGALSKSETTWVSRPFHLDKADPILGSPLVIELPPHKRSTQIIKIDYVTSPDAPSLHWLTEAQTAGKHHPLMYTLSSPIGARGWIPLQDTPLVRVTYTALIHTDRDVLAVMSARNDPEVKHNGDYAFVMRDAMPPGRLALVIGDLRFKATGPRTGVYAEKPLLADAAKEFADTETLLKTGEMLFGPYRFERCDLVVLPPAFSLAEAGYPRAPFISSTAVTGDRSREAIVARALSAAWAGDLVSGATVRDAWISAGLSRYMQNRIVLKVYGESRETTERILAERSLREDLAQMNRADQVLNVDQRGRDPAAPRSAADEKSALLFTFLGGKFGEERFDAFLQGYFDHFAFKSITTEEFLGYLKENLLDRYPGIVTAAQVAHWVDEPGLPPDAPLLAGHPYEPVDAARSAWLSGKIAAKKLDTRVWVTPQWTYFLDNMPGPLRRDQMAELDQVFNFTRSPNAEIAASWFVLVIKSAYQPGYARLEEFLKSNGRETLVMPVYVELMKTPGGEALAKRVYVLAKPLYQAHTAAALDAVVNPGSETADDE